MLTLFRGKSKYLEVNLSQSVCFNISRGRNGQNCHLQIATFGFFLHMRAILQNHMAPGDFSFTGIRED